MPQKIGLGSGNGRIVEYEDGTAGYIQSMSLTQAFRVKIADVTGFSVEKSGKLLTRKPRASSRLKRRACLAEPRHRGASVTWHNRFQPHFGGASVGRSGGF
jgi:hypothetical protein